MNSTGPTPRVEALSTRHCPLLDPADGPVRHPRGPRRPAFVALLALFAVGLLLGGCGSNTAPPATTGGTNGGPSSDGTDGTNGSSAIRDGDDSDGMKTIVLPLRSDGPKSLDPVRGSTVYDNKICSQFYETLLQYKYLVRPPALEPLLLSKMPEASEDGRTYSFELKENVHFHDDPCFPGGKGRKLVSGDVFYSWKRMADRTNEPKAWWLFENTIAGFDEYRTAQHARLDQGEPFDYDAPVEGFQVIDDRHFRVVLKEPVYRFTWLLAMFQMSVVPREAVEKYGAEFGRHPVGTGPFVLRDEKDWVSGKGITFYKNPSYHECYYPTEHMPEDKEHGLHLPAGTRVPIVDKVEMPFFVKDAPMWLQFQAGKLGEIQVPSEYWETAFLRRTRELRDVFKQRGITAYDIPLLDFIFYGFNMEDELVGGYGEKTRYLRQAISLAIDWDERNEAFYNGQNKIYDGPIPPGLDGYPKNDGVAPKNYRGPDLERARELLANAGYPGGNGLPVIDYFTSLEANNPEQAEMLTRHLAEINVQINVRKFTFSTLIEQINKKNAPMFAFAWSSDYPDGENNLALFYGPNESPGSNHYNYKNDEYDRLYEQILVMPPSEQRTALYEKMRDMIIEDCPALGSMARTRYYLINPWLKNFKPTEDHYNWIKYLDLDASRLQ